MGQSKKENIWQDRHVKVADWFCVFALWRGAGGTQQVPHQGQLPGASGETAENEAKTVALWTSRLRQLSAESSLSATRFLRIVHMRTQKWINCEHKILISGLNDMMAASRSSRNRPRRPSLHTTRGGPWVGGFWKATWGGGGRVSRVPSCRGLRLSMFSKPLGVGCFFFYIPSQRSLPTVSWVISDCNIRSTSSAESVTEGTQGLRKYSQTQQ